MQVRPFKLVGPAARAQVVAAAETALAAWRGDCGPAIDAAAGEAVPAMPSPGQVRACWRDGKRMVWLAWDDSLALQLQTDLFGAATGSAPLASSVAAGLIGALAAHLGQALLPANAAFPRAGSAVDPAPVDAAELASASGAVQFNVHIGSASILCVLGAAAVDALAPAKPAPALARLPVLAWRTALAQVPVRLTIEAGCAEVGAGSLLHCGPGDVIRLDRHADDPLQVRAPGGAPLFYGFLGRVGTSTAVEVTQHF